MKRVYCVTSESSTDGERLFVKGDIRELKRLLKTCVPDIVWQVNTDECQIIVPNIHNILEQSGFTVSSENFLGEYHQFAVSAYCTNNANLSGRMYITNPKNELTFTEDVENATTFFTYEDAEAARQKSMRQIGKYNTTFFANMLCEVLSVEGNIVHLQIYKGFERGNSPYLDVEISDVVQLV